MSKAEIRKTLLEKRRHLSDDFIRTASGKIAKNIINSEILKNASNVLIYLPINGEVDTLELLNVFRKRQVNVFLPAFMDGAWTISGYKRDDEIENVFGKMPQPKNLVKVDTVALDLIIMPGVAFDKKGSRLGMGVGAYDRLLQSSIATKVGLAYEFQIVDTIETEPHDVSVNYVVTEKRILKTI